MDGMDGETNGSGQNINVQRLSCQITVNDEIFLGRNFFLHSHAASLLCFLWIKCNIGFLYQVESVLQIQAISYLLALQVSTGIYEGEMGQSEW